MSHIQNERDNRRALALRKAGQSEQALAIWRRLLRLCPKSAVLYLNMALALEDLGNISAAEAALANAITLNPRLSAAHGNLASLLIHHAQGQRNEEAAAHLRLALADDADNPIYWNGLGVLAADEEQHEQAEQYFQRALRFNPQYAPARMNLGQLYLRCGRCRDAWALAGTERSPYANPLRQLPPYPHLPGGRYWKAEQAVSELRGRRLLIVPEQGLGDEIQFCRYLPLLKAFTAASTVSFVCRAALYPLLQQLTHIDALWPVCHLQLNADTRWPDHDDWCFLLDLPARFALNSYTAPCAFPYLRPPTTASDVPHLPSAQLKNDSHPLNVALVWQGNRRHSNDACRSLPDIHCLQALFAVPNCRFFSLQLTDEPLPEDVPVINLSRDIHDWGDTARCLSHMDVLISIDSAVAHLAGAMAIPVFLLLPRHRPDWRWQLNAGETATATPCYPHHRLFRQQRAGDWREVIERCATALRQWHSEIKTVA